MGDGTMKARFSVIAALLFCISHAAVARDGSIVAWGYNNYGQCDVPEPNSDFVAMAGCAYHSLGLKSDGSIMAWGGNEYGQCDVQEPNSDFVAVAAGTWHSLGLKAGGSIVAWGRNDYGQCDVPQPNSDFVGVGAGIWHSLGLKSDGSIVAWGINDYGQCDVPEPNSDFVAVAGGYLHSLGLEYIAVSVEDCCSPLPGSLSIGSVTPNPFPSVAAISFQTEGAGSVVLEVYDLSGRLVETLVHGLVEAGEHSAVFDGSGLAPGVYLIRLRSGYQTAAARAVLIR